MSLPDSPLSNNSQASRSSGDSYSSSSSTKQLLSSVISTNDPHPTHIASIDHIRIADKCNTSIANV
uniref:CSON014170 protein n=1 Tax=Culicoides sonorensis TaxID=179676 RepID=A0A336LH85_CULSO